MALAAEPIRIGVRKAAVTPASPAGEHPAATATRCRPAASGAPSAIIDCCGERACANVRSASDAYRAAGLGQHGLQGILCQKSLPVGE